MLNKKDYSKLPLDELLLEEKKIKKNEIYSAGFIGFLIGVMVYGFAKNGFGLLYIGIPLFIIFAIIKNTQTQKQTLRQIQEEIKVKNVKLPN